MEATETHGVNSGHLNSLLRAPPAFTLPQRPLSPIATVLATTELLEMILSFLNMRDLHCAQRVCRAFYATIEASKLLKTILWQEPMPMSEGAVDNLCEAVMPLRCKGMTIGALDHSDLQRDPSTWPEFILSMVFISIQPCQVPEQILTCSKIETLLVTQPPLRKMRITLFQPGLRQQSGDIERAEGLRLGDLLSKAAEMCNPCKASNMEGTHINCGRCSFAARIYRRSSIVAFSEVNQWGTPKRMAW